MQSPRHKLKGAKADDWPGGYWVCLRARCGQVPDAMIYERHPVSRDNVQARSTRHGTVNNCRGNSQRLDSQQRQRHLLVNRMNCLP
jgi:hypothetical protein